MEAKESGISVSAGLRLAFAAACMSTGISNANAATLFMIAESAADTADIRAMCAANGRVADTRNLPSKSIAPEFDSPLLTINTNAMITVAGWPKPPKTSSFGITPPTNATKRAPAATTSYRTRPQSSMPKSATRRAKRKIWGPVISASMQEAPGDGTLIFAIPSTGTRWPKVAISLPKA